MRRFGTRLHETLEQFGKEHAEEMASKSEIWAVEGEYGCGWEVVTHEETRADAIECTQVYRENNPGTPYRYRRLKESEL